MRAYRFHLDSVLRVRQVHYSITLAHLAAATRRAAEAQTRAEAADERYESRERPPGEMSGERFIDLRERGERLALDQAHAQHESARAAFERETRRLATVSAERSVRSLEQLDQRQHELHRNELTREEAKELDDFAGSRYIWNRKRQ